jgi:alanine-synthesizing transaminase
LPQVKLGWIAVSGPKKLAREALSRLEVIADTYLSVSTPVQLAAPLLLEQRSAIQAQLINRASKNICELDQGLEHSRGCSRLLLEGGWSVVLRVPVTRSDEELAIALLRECGVLVHPGHFYDFPGDGYLVVSSIVDTSIFAEGIARLQQFVSKF